jgi:hypothetical protein
MGGVGTSLASLAAKVRVEGAKLIFQREAEHRARAADPELARAILERVEGADRRFRLLGKVSGPDVSLATATLLRDAAILLLDAATMATAGEVSLEPRSDAERARTWERHCAEHGIPASTSTEGARLLEATNPLALDEIPSTDLDRAAHALLRIARSLRAGFDCRSAERIVWSRRGRVAGVSILLAAFAVLTLRALMTPPNVARGKIVTMSSLDPRGAVETALVDGVRSGDTAPGAPHPDVVQTHREATPWALIDLGKTYALRQVRVYNRDDGFFDEGLPYALDVSVDGLAFTELAQRTIHFGSWWLDPPWVVSLSKVEARYVRVRATNYLALSEVEAFAW